MIYKENGKWFWKGGFETKDIPKAAGFRWDPDKKVWWTQFIDVAAKLVKYAADKTELETYLSDREASLQASKASSAQVDLPKPDGLEYLPFQKAGIMYSLDRQNVLIGDEMGLGKTIQAIGVINTDETIKTVLIVCPNTVKLNWKRELEKWLTRKFSISIATSKSLEQTDIVIVNYDILSKIGLKSRSWDLLIADECNYIKNPDSIRTKELVGHDKKIGDKYVHVSGIADSARRKIFLTGTPILNRPIELWPIVHTLNPTDFRSFFGFAKRYCAAYQSRYGWDMSGASHLDELQDKLRSTIMVRRLKKDVLAELPAKRRQVIEVSQNGASEVVKHEQETIKRHEDTLADLKSQVELAKASDDEIEYVKAVQALKDAARVAFTEMARERHEVALAKVPQVIEHLQDVIDENKVVVFAHHHDVIYQIAEAFAGKVVTLTGENNLEERQLAIDRFQNDPSIMMFIGSIKAAGLGITLTASSHVVFAELDWVPGSITQAEDRCHRFGQQESVLIQHLVIDGSLDSRMAKTLVNKQDVIDKALDDETVIIPIEEPATSITNRKKLIESPDLAESEITEIHMKLKILDSMCDGAVDLDGVGFNKIDTRIGKSLATSSSLTQRQAKLGKLLVTKYRKQLES